jgi:AcrR family transcriptional regulator
VASKVVQKKKGSYHHGDLERALVAAAAEIVREKGVDALTLRGVGDYLGVSRTALYRHFEDKSALLARLAAVGFQGLSTALQGAIDSAQTSGREPLQEMAGAYVRYAISNPSHYRVMFGRAIDNWERYPDLVTAGQAAFALLFNTVVQSQQEGKIVAGDPHRLSQIIWSIVHGIAALGMDGHLAQDQPEPDELGSLAEYAARCMKEGIGGNAICKPK